MRKFVGISLVVTLLTFGGTCDTAQGQEKRTGTVIGELKSRKPTPNGKNVIIEVLAAGEEKARVYRVMYDQQAKGPIPAVLKAVREASVGDQVEINWVDTGEGLAMKQFQVRKKGSGDRE